MHDDFLKKINGLEAIRAIHMHSDSPLIPGISMTAISHFVC